MRGFTIFKRKDIYYAQLPDPVTGERLSPRSTGKTKKGEAVAVVNDWMVNGYPQQIPAKERAKPRSAPVKLPIISLLNALKAAELTPDHIKILEKILKEKGLICGITYTNTQAAENLEAFLKRFWDYGNSPYVREKKSHGLRIGKAYVEGSLRWARKYWFPHFKDLAVGQITREMIKDFSDDLMEDYPNLSPLTLRQIMLSGVTALRWAYLNKIITVDPTEGLVGYSTKGKKRGVLTMEEAQALFALKWPFDERYMLVNLIGMTTGLRIGEILAIKKENIEEDFLIIKHSFSQVDGLKSTKTGEERTVPILPSLRTAMLWWVELNPHGDDFVFFGEKPNQPFDQHEPLRALQKMLVKMKVGESADEKAVKEAEAYWKGRNIVFHSWRHFYAARMTDRLEASKVMRATGHKTEAVFKGYADHALASDLDEVAVATEAVFGGLLPEPVKEVQ